VCGYDPDIALALGYDPLGIIPLSGAGVYRESRVLVIKTALHGHGEGYVFVVALKRV
jgi:hypothetical protein